MHDLLIEGGLKWQTADIVSGLLTNNNAYVLSLNLPNDGYVSNLKPGGIVEIPAIIGADRIYGLQMGALPPAIAALMEVQLYIMDLVVDAAVTGNRQTALEALMWTRTCRTRRSRQGAGRDADRTGRAAAAVCVGQRTKDDCRRKVHREQFTPYSSLIT